ncbi:universal stress protein [Mycolicibacterium murale]|uniref:Universal stress protein n=1 Tax=Mycolicibacterium murale TaxID=182220 RepID=A0A7I9WP24_9MYCO|nr:universal stress protein [Mycolicibacterium murale]MCV7180379.1 universal stress protein [Mycolicibacterium murale]GFG59413.1 universal stress protein [Mycolicibacterium murale]
MKDRPPPSPAIVVGVDGSRAALTAALWAVAEAEERDLPLRLLYAIEPRPVPSADQAARDLAAAEISIREAFMAIEALNLPLKIEVEIVQDNARRALINASYSALMLCLGSRGIGQSTGRHYGSVAAVVSRTARCPVAIIAHPHPPKSGFILAELDDSPDRTNVLEISVAEALLRHRPLRVLASWRPRFSDVADASNTTAINRQARGQLDKQLEWWRRRHPSLDIAAVITPGNMVNYVAQHRDLIELLVVGQRQAGGNSRGPNTSAHPALSETTCSLLICGSNRVL